LLLSGLLKTVSKVSNITSHINSVGLGLFPPKVSSHLIQKLFKFYGTKLLACRKRENGKLAKIYSLKYFIVLNNYGSVIL